MKIKTVTEQIVEILRGDILSGKYLPGSKLKEKEISGSLNISRTPVREAFRILESDGLVEINPNRGVQVPLITEEYVNEVCELRLVLETYCFRKFASTFDENDFQAMKHILEKAEYAITQEDYFSYVENSFAFHEYISSRCANKRLYYAFLNCSNNIRLTEIAIHKKPKLYIESLNLRMKILETLKKGDPAKAEKLLQEFLKLDCQTIKRNLDITINSGR